MKVVTDQGSRGSRAAFPVLIFCFCALTLCGAGRARAERCAAIAGGSPALSEIAPEVRLRFIQQRLRHAARNARIWSYGWGSLYTALTVVNLSISPAFNSNERIDYYVGTGSAAVGVASFLLAPLKVMHDQRALDRLIAQGPRDANPCVLLAEAEKYLLRDAQSEAFGKGLFVRFAGVAFNIGVGALLGFAFGHWGEASINMMAGVAVGQIMIATQPEDAVTDLARYRTGSLAASDSATSSRMPFSLTPVLSPTGQGGYGFILARPF